jgi:hypothetical protein
MFTFCEFSKSVLEFPGYPRIAIPRFNANPTDGDDRVIVDVARQFLTGFLFLERWMAYIIKGIYKMTIFLNDSVFDLIWDGLMNQDHCSIFKQMSMTWYIFEKNDAERDHIYVLGGQSSD